ncbi:DNA primase [Sphingomonas jaspsi]|uniref:DNA primase n=1 Tax=Sphingomonas jaspsi TaxID=392409 RepID=UPI0004B7660D|nr:DNA primase [Sphingomonas jaspsi]
MNLSPAWLDELRARTTLSAVIAPTLKLTKAGREFKACCPFHNEKTPSFYINDEKGFYHCFGCGAHGDAIRFLTDQRGLPFMDAVKDLATKAGMDVPAPDPRSREKQERAAGLHDVMAAAQRWFVEQLEGVDGGAARAYLKERGITEATRQKFGFGFAPDSRGKLKAALASFGNDKLVEAGLLIQPDDNKEPYDRFRGRLTYPIRDVRGRVIAFSARILGAGEPKYLNSPDTPLFDKGRTLFNIDLAGPASRNARRVLIVEGQMDVIALDQAGIGEVVAPLGTALTEDQIQRLWRLEPAPICCFDGDSAGQKAAIRAATRALPHLGPERTLRFVDLPQGKDPDDVVKSGGKAAMEELLAKPDPLVDRLWRYERDAQPLDTPEARAGLKQRLFDHVQAIQDPSVRQLYRDEWLRRFDELVRPQAAGRGAFTPRQPWKKNREGRFVPPPPPASAAARAIASGGIDKATARALVYGHALFPDAIGDHVELFATLPLADKAASNVRDRMIDLTMSGQALDREGLVPILATDGTASDWKQVSKGGDLGFTFTRSSGDPDLARRDLAMAMETVAAKVELDAAFEAAMARFRAGDDSAFEEQQKLHAAREVINDRLASLAGNE